MDSSKYRLCGVGGDAAIVLFATYHHIIRRVCPQVDPILLSVPADFDAQQLGDLADGEIVGFAAGLIDVCNDRGNILPVGGLVGFSGEDFILTEQGDSSLVVLYPAGSGQRGAHSRNRHECRDYTCRKRTILLHNDSSLFFFFYGWVLALYSQDAGAM